MKLAHTPFLGCVDMDGRGQVRAGREVCWVEHQAVLGTDNQVADFKPTPNNRTIPCYARLHNNGCSHVTNKQLDPKRFIVCLRWQLR